MGIWAVILGILAVLCALFGTFLFGTVGGIATAVVAVVAILLGVTKRRKDHKGGIAAVVLSVAAVILAFVMNGVWTNDFKQLHDQALQYKPDGVWAQVSDVGDRGAFGLIKNLPKDDASLNKLLEEMKELKELSGK